MVEDNKKILYSNLHSNPFICFWEEDFQRINTHSNWKNSPSPKGASITRAKFVLATLVEDHKIMPIYSQICPLVSEKIFKELISIIIGKTAPTPWWPHLLTEQVCYSNFAKGSLDDHLYQSTVKSVLNF